MGSYTPHLAIATGLIEVAIGVWVLRSVGNKRILRPAAIILFLLAGYQFLEVIACSGAGGGFASQLAFANIVWLPAVGLWLLWAIAWPERRRYLPGLYLAAASALALRIIQDPSFTGRTVCELVFARYGNEGTLYTIFGVYYQSGLALMVLGASRALGRIDDALTRRHLSNLQMGTLAFLLAALLTELAAPQLGGAMPSIMCHYAIFLAIGLGRIAVDERQAATGHDMIREKIRR